MKLIKLLSCLLIGGACLYSCSKSKLPDDGSNADAASSKKGVFTPLSTTAVSLAINDPGGYAGSVIPSDFTGLSYETSTVCTDDYFNSGNTTFINLINGLGKGVIRIGGNAADKTFWHNTTRGSDTRDTVIYQDDITRFNSFVENELPDWKIMFGLNMGNSNTNATIARQEALYASDVFGSRLLAFELGNEADLWGGYLKPPGYSRINFFSDWTNFRSTINGGFTSAGEPLPPYAGPTFAGNIPWLDDFTTSYINDVAIVNHHYYNVSQSNPSTGSATIAGMLEPDNGLITNLPTFISYAAKGNKPFRFSECNSISNGGVNGVSNAFASALWGIDYMFYCASKGVDGVNFHGGLNPAINAPYYTPIKNNSGTYTATPIYYAMLMWKISAINQFRKAALTANGLNVTSYYFQRTDGKRAILFINKEETENAGLSISGLPANAVLTLHKLTTDATVTSNYAAALTGKVMLAGSKVDANGNWASSSTSTVTANGSGNVSTFTIRAAQAVLMVIN
ncbi:hypothetical protein [Chitinophaga barathri]|uniref:Beta-glucuronidase C-terminal domain-containing protein n=1 Tax=Chitinophaga barathri TaxID=1647451 RepID=A0A3N4MS92_9BACT|nr:hypothetical protein [Chitinophaga barathri]RPD43010.1 hypothetical protein EG028_01595 [Chitinophaga barathri]